MAKIQCFLICTSTKMSNFATVKSLVVMTDAGLFPLS